MHEIFVNMNNWFQTMGVQGLALNSCIESFFLIPPPDFLLIAMDLAKPEKALYYATICTLASALGGTIGYFIGLFGGRPVFNFLFRKNANKLDNILASSTLNKVLTYSDKSGIIAWLPNLIAKV